MKVVKVGHVEEGPVRKKREKTSSLGKKEKTKRK